MTTNVQEPVSSNTEPELEYKPDFLSKEDADSFFAELLALPWEQHIIEMYGKKIPAPRLYQWMGVPPRSLYGAEIVPIEWTPAALAIKAKVDAATGHTFNSLNINYYRDNADHLGWHRDKEIEGLWTEPIASVSLGAVRKFQVRRGKGNKVHSINLEHGSLVVMPPGFQKEWLHRLAKTSKVASQRINLTFRVMGQQAHTKNGGAIITNQGSELLSPKRMAAYAGPEIDFISTYVEFADRFEISAKVHALVGVQLIASVLNQNAFFEWGGKKPFDLWVLLLSGSGQGRNTATDVALEIIDAAGMKGLLQKSTWGSKAAFYQQVAETSGSLYSWQEFAVALQTLNDSKFKGVKEWLTDRYDNFQVPESIVYRDTKKSSDTPPIEFANAPRLNILATSSSDWFLKNTREADITGGFLARWLILRVGKSDRVIPKPREADLKLRDELADRLRQIAKLSGPADIPEEIQRSYTQWYCDPRSRFENQPNADLEAPFFNRLRVELLKLAVIFEVSQSGTLQVTREAYERAVWVVEEAQETMREVLPSALSQASAEIEKMAKLILDAGRGGISKSDLTRTFQHWKSGTRNEHLRTLVTSERVHVARKRTTGRSVEIYVHAHFMGKPAASAKQE